MTTPPPPRRSAASTLPRLDSLDHLRNFLHESGYFPEDARIPDDLFALPPHLRGPDDARIIALAGDERNDPTLTVLFVPRAYLTREVLLRMRRTLANRSLDGMVVCTDDWQLMTLYLLRQQDEQQQPAPQTDAQQQPAPRPVRDFPTWTMNIHELRPNDLQALQLLAIHEADMFELDRHLLRAFKRAERETLYNNQGFFSNYYLLERVERDLAEWCDMAASMEALRAAIEAVLPAPGATLDAEATRAQVVLPILAALGWKADPASATARYDLALKVGGKRRAICNVVAAGESLSLPNDTLAQHEGSPDMRMIAALTSDGDAEMPWGILTNGTVWRLFSKVAESASGVYYEIDVPDLLAVGQTSDLRFFAAFFGAAGLAPTPAQPVSLALRIYQNGQHSAQKVGEDLKKAIFDEVFVYLATALAEAMRRRGDDVESAEGLARIYRATLILLYRLLFLLYAESRRLLPTLHLAYYPHSLSNLLKHIALQRNRLAISGTEKPLDATAPWIWQRLKEIFRAVDAGQPTWGVPRYNGGLFSDDASDAHALLASLDEVGALFLSVGLDGLARDQVAQNATTINGALRLIDYMALDVRRLGSIYEGLLEFQLCCADQTLVWRDDQWQALAKGQKLKDNVMRVEKGQLYLQHTRRERKASGSYYTPDYIVRYIVEHAVGPVFKERVRLFADTMNRLRTRRTELRRATSSATVQHLRGEVERLEQATRETLLDLKILDPAMGSGHFLVSTVDYLSDQMIAVLEQYADNPIYPHLRTIRESILESLRNQGIGAAFISEEQLSNRNLLRRMVMKRCVYGVDLNDLAVELARLSLWLHSFTVGAPLSFLDHHLKWGNSLIGTRVTEVEQELKADLFGGPFAGLLAATTQMTELVQIADATYAELERSEALYRDFEQAVAPYKAMLDIWVSQHFGNRYAKDFLTLFQGDTVRAVQGEITLSKNHQGAIEQGRTLAADKRFFHWDLEFPEVFVDLQRKHWKVEGEAGFDAVIGNPPWTRITDTLSVKYFKDSFSTIEGKQDTYRLFMERAISVLHQGSWHSFVVPSSFLSIPAAKKLRTLLIRNFLHNIAKVQTGAFEEVSANIVVYVLETPHKGTHMVCVEDWESGSVKYIRQADWERGDCVFSIDISGREQRILERVSMYSFSLFKEYEYVLGMQLYHNTTHKQQEMKERIHHLSHYATGYTAELGGSNIDRYSISLQDTDWVKIDRNKAYSVPNERFFKDARIIVREIPGNKSLVASLISEHVYSNKSTMIVRTTPKTSYSLEYLLCSINSKLVYFCFAHLASKASQALFPRLSLTYLRNLPIRRIHFTTPKRERTRRVKELSAQADAMTAPDAPLAVLREVGPFRASALGQALAALLPTDDNGLFLAFAQGASGAEEHSDVVHDLLAHLAQRMIDLNKQKQQEMQRYLGGLEQRLDIAHGDKTGIAALSGKTTLQNYLGDYQKGEEAQPWEAVLAVLSKNKGKFGVGKQVLEAPQVGRLRADYERSLATLAPIKAQLARTDALIDQVVYLLYGLSADEVAVVEGA